MHTIKKLKFTIIKQLPQKLRCRLTRSTLPALNPNPEDIFFRPAEEVDDYIKCFRLLHDVYVQAGYSKPSETALRITPHHSEPKSRVFLGCIKDNGLNRTPIYTISLFPDGDLGLPMDMAFKKELDILRSKGLKLAEAGCLASNPSYRRGDKNIPMLGNRLILDYAANHLEADELVITIHPKYLWIYEDILLFERIGETSSYSYVNGNPAVALKLNLKTMIKEYKKAYAFAPLERDLHHFFFEAPSKSIDLSTEKKKDDTSIMGVIAGYYSLFGSFKTG